MKTRCGKRQVLVQTTEAILVLMCLLLGSSIRAAKAAFGADEQVARGVNLGGGEVDHFERDDPVRDDEGIRWTTDVVIDTNSVVDPAPQAVYQTGIAGKFGHTFDSLAPGEEYTVRIHCVEIFAEEPGERVSDVYINGEAVRSGYDIFGATGAQYVAVAEEYVVAADASGRVTVDLIPADPTAGGIGAGGIEIRPFESPELQPTSWWRFDELGGVTARDAVGRRDGIVKGASWDIGRFGGALQFDGVDDHVVVSDTKGLIDGPFSVTAWVRAGRPGQVIASQENGVNWLMASPLDGALMTELTVSRREGRPLPSKVIITDGHWHRIWVLYDGEQVSLFADGTQVASAMPPSPSISSGASYIGTGADQESGSFWAGMIDDVRVYDRALTPTEVSGLWDDALKVETTFYYSRPTERVPLTVNLDRLGALGAVPANGATEKEIRRFVDAYLQDHVVGVLKIVQPGNIIILELPSTLARTDLARLAREIRSMPEERDVPSPFAEIGMVVRAGEEETPMLVLDDFVVQFQPKTSRERIDRLNADEAVEVVWENPYVPNQFLLRVTGDSRADAMRMANEYHENDLTEYAAPDFVVVRDIRRHIPNDEFFPSQWHHDNTAQGGGTVDADIDAPEAWNMTTGSEDVVIAVIDVGFDIAHPDLVQNLWVNPGEIKGNDNEDDDDNGYVDDIHGWDFTTNMNTLAAHKHGTSAAGCAGATGDNIIGVSGSSPNCSLMLLRLGTRASTDGLAFDYARANGADIISNSWGYDSGTTGFPYVRGAIRNAALNGRNGLGCVVLFAMTNDNIDNGGNPHDISALDSVIAVSSATNQDCFNLSGYGNCMDVLGPSHRGTRWIVTTDNQGSGGYNCNQYSGYGCPPPAVPSEPSNRDYTFCFGGTSAACPIVAGVAGLILDVNRDLARLAVQRLLQDTADKIEDSQGHYSEVNGFSSPASGVATHGYGRVNAFEAVRVAAPRAAGGCGGVDIFLRDNRLDWGNTEQPSHMLFEPTRGFIPHWESVDIKVDAPPFEPTPTDSTTFDAILHENPKESKTNRVYVRVRNRGHRPASNITVKLHWCFVGTALPALPAGDFWDQFPGDSADTTQWKPLGTKPIDSLSYSGCSVAGTSSDAARIVSFDFLAPAIDPAQAQPRHYCLLVIADSKQDPVSPEARSLHVVDAITPNENNVTHHNVVVVDSSEGTRSTVPFFLRNPHGEPIHVELDCDVPEGWTVLLDDASFATPFEADLSAGEEMLKTLSIVIPGPNATGDVILTQTRTNIVQPEIMGGLTCRVGPM